MAQQFNDVDVNTINHVTKTNNRRAVDLRILNNDVEEDTGTNDKQQKENDTLNDSCLFVTSNNNALDPISAPGNDIDKR